MPPITPPKPKPNGVRIALSGLAAGACSAFVCLMYKFVYTRYSGFSLESYVNSFYIVAGCFAGALLAAMGYYLLSKLLTKPAMLFVFVVFVLMLASLFAPLSGTLPDQTTAPSSFPLLTVPMHVFTGLIITYLIPAIAGPPKLIYNY